MTPRQLELNFLPRDTPVRWMAYVIFALALVVGIKLTNTFLNTRNAIGQLESHAAGSQSRHTARNTSAAIPDAVLREADQINQIIDELTVPWDKLFLALEAVHRDRVAVLAITPDQNSGSVEISAEAADPGALFDYIDRLQEQPALTRVYLLNHKTSEQDPQHAIRFTVSASWLNRDSN